MTTIAQCPPGTSGTHILTHEGKLTGAAFTQSPPLALSPRETQEILRQRQQHLPSLPSYTPSMPTSHVTSSNVQFGC